MFNFQKFIVILCITLLTACGGSNVKPDNGTRASTGTSQPSKGKGGYYLDDGPGDNPPADIDSIPDAQLKTETLLVNSNKPYAALGKKYVPMTTYTPYSQQGIASWYGRRYHGKKTSSGETYDMYAMTGAHTTLPIPSYVRVTNPANKRSVIVRINDRGPFKHDRLIDLSYAAAYKLRLTGQGSGLVEVEWIDTSPEALQKMNSTRVAETVNNTPAAKPEVTPVTYNQPAAMPVAATPVVASPVVATPAVSPAATPATTAKPAASKDSADNGSLSYYVQVGAFKNELNGDTLQKKVIGLDIAGNAAVTNVYNDGLYRVKLGPFDTRKEADISASKIRKQLNMPAIVTNQ